jgi:hypothetical protein
MSGGGGSGICGQPSCSPARLLAGMLGAAGSSTVDVDQQGRVRHLDATCTLHATPSAQPERVTIEMSFSDFGAPVRVSTPPAGDVFTL